MQLVKLGEYGSALHCDRWWSPWNGGYVMTLTVNAGYFVCDSNNRYFDGYSNSKSQQTDMKRGRYFPVYEHLKRAV